MILFSYNQGCCYKALFLVFAGHITSHNHQSYITSTNHQSYIMRVQRLSWLRTSDTRKRVTFIKALCLYVSWSTAVRGNLQASVSIAAYILHVNRGHYSSPWLIVNHLSQQKRIYLSAESRNKLCECEEEIHSSCTPRNTSCITPTLHLGKWQLLTQQQEVPCLLTFLFHLFQFSLHLVFLVLKPPVLPI